MSEVMHQICCDCVDDLTAERDEALRQLAALTAEASGLREALAEIGHRYPVVKDGVLPCSRVTSVPCRCAGCVARRALAATPAVPMTLDPLPDVVLNVIVDEALRIGNFAALANAKTPDPRPELLRRIREALARPQTAEPTPAKVCTRPEQCTNPKWCEAEEKCEREPRHRP